MGYIHTGTEHYIIEPLPAEVMLVNSFISSAHHHNSSHDNTTIATSSQHHTPPWQQENLHQQGSRDEKSHPEISASNTKHHIIYRHDTLSGSKPRATLRKRNKGNRTPPDVPTTPHTCGQDPGIKRLLFKPCIEM